MFSRPAICSSRIAVLISVSNPETTPIFRSKDWSLSKDLKNYFEKKMGETEFDVVYFENATQERLHAELINPDNFALFWISHSTSFEAHEEGLGFEDTIVDVEGKNVRDIFQKIHPNLKYLSVLGCKAGPILTKIKEAGFLENNSELIIYAKDSLIRAKKEIKHSIKDFKEKIQSINLSTPLCKNINGIPIEIHRTVSNDINQESVATSVKVMNQGVFLGLFPKAIRGEKQTITVFVSPEKIKSVSHLKLVFDSGLNKSTTKPLLGTFEIQSRHFNGVWGPFKTPKGEVLGLSRHIYRYSGSIENLFPLESYNPFDCRIN